MNALQQRIATHQQESVKYFVHTLYYWFIGEAFRAVLPENALIWHQQQQYFNEQKLKRGAIA